MATATSSPPAPMPSMPMPPAVGVWLSEPMSVFSGDGKALEMDLMANPIAGTREANAVFFRYRLDITVIVGVFKARLQGVVVDVGDGKLCFDALCAHCLKLQIRHRAGGVLCQCLIDAKPDFRAGLHLPRDKVGSDDFLCECVSHVHSFLNMNLWIVFQRQKHIGERMLHMRRGQLLGSVRVMTENGVQDFPVLLYGFFKPSGNGKGKLSVCFDVPVQLRQILQSIRLPHARYISP